MRLVSLKLRNFMPYKCDQDVTFAVKGNRNVTLIYGDNMRGKTSLLNAIRWALYGRALGRHLRPIKSTDILNKDAFHERDFMARVALTFVHQGEDFEIVRTMKPRVMIDTPREEDHYEITVSMKRNQDPIPGDQVDVVVGHVLSESISRFALFDGELLQEYEQLVAEASSESDKIKDAIEKALGVPALTNGRAHIAELLHRAQKQFAKEGAKDSQHAKLSQALLDELEGARKEQQELTQLKERTAGECEQLDDDLRRYARAEAVHARVSEVQQAQATATESQERAMHRRRQLAPRGWLALVSPSLAAKRLELEGKLLDVRGTLESSVRIRVEERLRLLSLQTGQCALCGERLEDLTRERLKSREGPPPSADVNQISSELAQLTRQLERLETLGAGTIAHDLIEAEREYDRSTVELIRLKQREADLLAEIPGIDTTELERKRSRFELLQREIGRIDGQIAAQNAKCTELQKRYDALIKTAASGSQVSSQLIARKVRLLTAMNEIFEKSVDRLRSKLRSRVQQSATDTFCRLTTEKQYKGLVINDRYGLEIRDQLDRPVSVRSAGAEQIVALSLIDGLSHASGSAGVLVMDTPFGRLDLKHRSHVLSHLPQMAEQIVLLVHEGELSRTRDLAPIADFVSGQFEIGRVSPTQSIITRL